MTELPPNPSREGLQNGRRERAGEEVVAEREGGKVFVLAQQLGQCRHRPVVPLSGGWGVHVDNKTPKCTRLRIPPPRPAASSGSATRTQGPHTTTVSLSQAGLLCFLLCPYSVF